MFFVIQLFTYYFLLSFLVLKDHEDTHWSFQFTLYILKVCLVLLVLAHSLSLFCYSLFLLGKPLGIYVAVADFTPSKDAKNQIPMKTGQSYRVVKKEDSGKKFLIK